VRPFRRLLLRSLVFALLLGGLPASSFGQGTYPGRSSVVVTVRESPELASREALVSIEAADAAAAPSSAVERTAPIGVPVVFGGLRSGAYLFRVEVPGARPVGGQLRVGSDEIVVVGATPVPAGDQQPAPTVTHQPRDHQRTVFDTRLLRDLPAATSLWGLVETAAPSVISDTFDNGGLGSVRPARFGARGESWRMLPPGCQNRGRE